MAYTFNSINQMLDPNAGKQDIFTQGSGGQDQGGGSSQQGSGGAQPVSKDVGGGAVGSQGQSQAQSQAPQAKSSSAQAIMKKAEQSNLDTSGYTKGIKQNIQNTQSKLEDEANKFVQTQASRAKPALDSNTISSATSGDEQAYNRLEQTLRGPRTQAENFQFGQNTKFQDLDNMQTQGGLQETLRKRGNERYTQGQAALDAMLISRDKNFQQNVQEAKKQRDALRNKQLELEGGSKQAEAQAAIDAQEAQARQQALAELSGLKGRINQEVDQRRDLYGNYLEQARLRAPKELASLETQLREELAKEDASLAPFMNYADVEEGGFLNLNRNDRGREDFYTPETAQRYNRILDLLGEGGQRLSGVADVGAYSTYNKQGLKQALRDRAAQARDQYNARPQQGMANINSLDIGPSYVGPTPYGRPLGVNPAPATVVLPTSQNDYFNPNSLILGV